jgi:uncharacterized protein
MRHGDVTLSSRFFWHPMENKRQTVIGITVFLFLLTALSVPLFIPMVRGRTIYPGDSIWWVLGVMWCPGVAALATRLIFQRTLRGVGWRWGKWKYQWASYLIPMVYPAVVYVPLLAVGYGDYARKAHNALAGC